MYHTIAEIAVARYREGTALRRGELRRRTAVRRRLPALPAPHLYRLDSEPVPPSGDRRLLCFARAGERLADIARRWYGDPGQATLLARANRLPPGKLPQSMVLRLPLFNESCTIPFATGFARCA